MLVKDLVLMKFWLWVSSCSDVVDKRSSHLFTSTLRQNIYSDYSILKPIRGRAHIT